MGKHNIPVLISYVCVTVVCSIVFADLAGIFGFSDFAFLFGLLFWCIALLLQKGKSRASFVVSLFLLFFMGLSYIPTGAGPITERIGEWFYLFFVCGLVQYTKEAWYKTSV